MTERLTHMLQGRGVWILNSGLVKSDTIRLSSFVYGVTVRTIVYADTVPGSGWWYHQGSMAVAGLNIVLKRVVQFILIYIRKCSCLRVSFLSCWRQSVQLRYEGDSVVSKLFWEDGVQEGLL